MSAQELPEAHVIVGAGTGIALETGGLDQQGPRLALSGEGLLGRFAYMVATEAVTVLLGTLYWSLSARLVAAHAGARGGPGGGRLLRARGPRGGARRHPRGSALLLPMFLSKSLCVESVGDAGVLRRSIRVTFPVGLLTCLAVIAGLEEGGHLILSVFGARYVAGGLTPLRLLALGGLDGLCAGWAGATIVEGVLFLPGVLPALRRRRAHLRRPRRGRPAGGARTHSQGTDRA